MAKATRSKNGLYLLGDPVSELTGSKLPSLRMALGFFLHIHIELKEIIRKASSVTIKEIANFWQRARIPMRDHQHCQKKLENLFEEWRLLKKNKARTSPTQRAKELTFVSKLEDLFDVAHADSLIMTSVLQEDKDFLIAQRKKGRIGSMAGVDKKLAAKEKRVSERKEKIHARRQRIEQTRLLEASVTEHVSPTDSENSSAEDGDEDMESKDNTNEEVSGKIKLKGQRRKRGRKAVVTSDLATALDRTDRTKVSDRKAFFIIAETAKSLGQNINELALNRDSIRRQRIEHRVQKSANIKAKFEGNVPLVVHWDGKLIRDLSGKDKVDRLPVLVSGKGVSKLLTVAKLPSGTGEAQAAAIFEAIKNWGIASSICGMCFDTTSSNTGHMAGACVLLEQKLEKELLSLACRHHIMELIIGAVFEVCLGVTSSPEVSLFKRFKEYWRLIDAAKYEPGIATDIVADLVEDIKHDTIEYANKQLEENQPRGDYKELLELVIIFLGAAPVRGVRFMSPGAMHHARWMSKVIYSLKIWMFKAQFKLTPKEEKGLRDVCVFTVRVYMKAWISAPQAISAPYNDLLLLKLLIDYSSINSSISKSASHKFCNHLWYLSQELVALAFFDSRVSSSTKRLMVSALQNEENKNQKYQKRSKGITVVLHSFKSKNLEDFVTTKSMILFRMLELPDGFLTVDPDLWEVRDDYKKAMETIRSLKVVNDNAERGVALIQEYSGLITHDEMQLQFLMQVVEDHRRLYPDSRKQTLFGV